MLPDRQSETLAAALAADAGVLVLPPAPGLSSKARDAVSRRLAERVGGLGKEGKGAVPTARRSKPVPVDDLLDTAVTELAGLLDGHADAVLVATADPWLDALAASIGERSITVVTPLAAALTARELTSHERLVVLVLTAAAATDPAVQAALAEAPAGQGRIVWLAGDAGLVAEARRTGQLVHDLAAVALVDRLLVIEPRSTEDVARCLRFALAEAPADVYVRLGACVSPGPSLGQLEEARPGRGTVLRTGFEAWLVTAGPATTPLALDVASHLTRSGTSTGVVGTAMARRHRRAVAAAARRRRAGDPH
ncbi:MAG: hypothetical protein WKF94_08955 [Solirubrobacteraceae bacterium]